ncbi:MAG: TonB-dependent receptor plug domain-containing protein [Myxococcota bacterium]
MSSPVAAQSTTPVREEKSGHEAAAEAASPGAFNRLAKPEAAQDGASTPSTEPDPAEAEASGALGASHSKPAAPPASYKSGGGVRPPPSVEAVPAIDVVERRAPQAGASEGTLTREQLELLPLHESESMLQRVPGLQLSKHGGEGKAAQFFLRGFDAAHGAELAVSLEGIPLNEVSNIHGQGYLDLYFLPHALVERLEYLKGIPSLDVGNFAVAGAAQYVLLEGVEYRSASFFVGTDSALGIRMAARPFVSLPQSFLTLELEGAGGPWRLPQRDYWAIRLSLGGSWHQSAQLTRFFVLAYDGSFESPGVLRLDDLTLGIHELYDTEGFEQGGHSQRILAGFLHRRQQGQRLTELLFWGGARGLQLRHNFTGYYLNGPEGDTRIQEQQTLQAGARLKFQQPLPTLARVNAQLLGGLSLRLELLGQREAFEQAVSGGERVTYAATGLQTELGGWAESQVKLGQAQLSGGVRLDRLDLWRNPTQESPNPEPDPVRQVYASGSVWQPRLSLRLPLRDPSWPVFLLGGRRGFRAPELRGLSSGVAPIPVADSAEVGVWQGLPHVGELRLLLFGTWITDELVFDHTAGRFLSTGSTQRLGGETTLNLRLKPLTLGLELSYADGRYVVTQEPLPFAPRWLGALELSMPARPLPRWPDWAGEVPLLTAGLRTFLLGRRPLPEGFASQPTLSTSLKLSLQRTRQSWALEVENLFLQRNFDGEFVYPSHFDLSTPRSELPVVHITAGTPFSMRLSVAQVF